MKKFQDIKRIAAMSVFSTVLFGQIMCQGSVFFENDGNVYVYFSSGNYEVVTDTASGATAEIASGIGDSSYATVKFSPDGQYMYYITGYNAGVADLWRCEYRKLQADSADNEKYCQFIASNISYSSFEATNKGVAFKDENYELYYFDGNAVRSLGQDVNEFWCTEDGEKIAFECGGDYPTIFFSQEEYDEYLNSTQTLYGVETSNLDNVFVLAEDYQEVFDITDFDNIFFSRSSENEWEQDIYVTDFANGPRRLGTFATGMTKPENGTVYYTRESEKDWDVNEVYMDSRGETQDIIDARANFAESKEAGGIKDLYVYKNGNEKKITSLVQNMIFSGEKLGYGTWMSIIPIDLAMGAEALYRNENQRMYYWISVYTDNPIYVNLESYSKLGLVDIETYMNKCDILVETDGGELVATTVTNGEFNSSTCVAQNASVLEMDESAIYYMISDDNSDYCSIYKLTDGKSTCIAQDVEFGVIYLYSDGSTTARSYNDSLILTDGNGNRQEIASGVSSYVRADESTVLYISDYNAWIWQNGESRLLGTNGERVWCSNPLEKVHYLGYTYSLH